ncbi:type II toxin-antitoxin system ParD family antitoxin [Marivibrio halodurans]|uniref:Type II toxin-antitoxin system ParD family antitoxin n=1 Tax=Marivibrio halodurans TaxID=2039722 RepID=A0A8J7SMI6_9PROT|nr:type II toxin-antitoxin system ParD family antitoxin [Marivibrio halodurans]MBP5857418.1 type II toxin-antitoxin system ParD family antitoxin [Marivibrio halodurans]
MPTRNINLTDHYAQYVENALASGRYKNASEVVRAALRLLERQESEDAAKIEALRAAFKEGEDAYLRGDFTALESDAEIDRVFEEIAEEVDRAR